MTNKAASNIAPLAISMGDPAGCGPQLSMIASAQAASLGLPNFFVIGVPEVLAEYGDVTVIRSPDDVTSVDVGRLAVLPSGESMPEPVVPGQGNPAHAPATIRAIELGVSLCQSGAASGLVTNPINKAVLYKAGFEHPGHTEFLANLCQTDQPIRPVMMLVGGGLRVSLATIHIALRNVPDLLTTDLLIEIGKITEHALVRDFGISAPRIAFSGLNPHAGEAGSLGREEIEIINPAAEHLRKRGINISDARSADTLFAETLSGAFDAVIAMTHDQGLIPVKTLDFWGGVNVTLGLPIVRTSPDHGTAYEAAAKKSVRADSLIAAIRTAGEIAMNRAKAGSS